MFQWLASLFRRSPDPKPPPRSPRKNPRTPPRPRPFSGHGPSQPSHPARPKPGSPSLPAGEYLANPVQLTPRAAAIILQTCDQQQMPRHSSYVRAFITQKDGGFLYGLDICEDAIDPKSDYQTHSRGIRIVVDHHSAIFLVGAQIDYGARGQEQGFIFNNPNAMPG